MQIWKSANIFVLFWKQRVEDFTLKYLLLFKICSREVCENLAYKHSETIEYAKNQPTFLRNLLISRENNSKILRIENEKFSGYCFYINIDI